MAAKKPNPFAKKDGKGDDDKKSNPFGDKKAAPFGKKGGKKKGK
jgi:hypothetical protein